MSSFKEILGIVLVCVFVSALVEAATSTGRGRHGDSCNSDRDCVSGIRCNSYAHRCQVQITADELSAQRDRVLSGRARVTPGQARQGVVRPNSASSNGHGRHGDPCTSDGDCSSGLKCHRYANRCQVQITAEELMAQRQKVLGPNARL